MDAASDELTKPVGADRVARVETRAPALSRGLAAALALVVAGGAGYAWWFGDSLGGIPHVTVPIRRAPAIAASPLGAQVAGEQNAPATRAASAAAAPPAGQPDRRGAADIESTSGVVVTRPSGTAAPPSVIVRVPDETVRLAPSPDPRLVEKSRYGVLPKVGVDGAKPADVYARPVGTLPGGAAPVARISIVVGGLGISESGTADAITRLPPAVTLAFAPYGANVAAQSAQAREAGHETLLQVPMEPFDYPDSDPGPHTLTTAARPAENLDHLRWAFGRITGYVGIMNYMGGKLTADTAALAPVLREVETRGLLMLDDGSSTRSVVSSVAAEGRAGRADAALDLDGRPDAVDKALAALERAALSRGSAIGVASALPVTVERVRVWARNLASRGILLVPASAAIKAAPGGRSAEKAAP